MDSEHRQLTPTEQRMATEDLKKLVLMYSIPTIISMFINALYNVVDRFWVGKIPGAGKEALAGVGLTMPIMTIGLGGAMLIGIGAAANISINLGKREHEKAERVLGNTLTLSIIVGALFSIFGLLFKSQLIWGIGASDVTYPFANDYLTIILIGCIFQILSFALNHPIRAAGNPKRFATTQLIGAILNIILDPIFILVLDMGVKGAAYATILSMMVSTIFVFQYYFSDKTLLKIHKRNLSLNKETVTAIMAIGFSPFLMQVAASVVGFVINRQLKFYGDLELGNGDVAISAMTVINGLLALVIMPVFGINQGAQPIIGFNYGAGNYQRVKEAYKWSTIYSVIISFISFVFVEIFARSIVKSFNDSPDLVNLGTFGMRIMLSTCVFIGFQAPSVNFFTAIGKAKLSAFLSLLRQVIVLIPSYLIFPLFFGLNGLWFAQPFSDIVASVLTAVYIIKIFRDLKVNMVRCPM